MPTLTATYGLPGSGKSFWAHRELASTPVGSLVRVNHDSLRWMLHGSNGHEQLAEQQVTTASHTLVAALLATTSVIVDDTNLHPSRLAELAAIANLAGARFLIQDFTHVPLATCIARDALRIGPERVGENVIRGMHAAYLSAGSTQ